MGIRNNTCEVQIHNTWDFYKQEEQFQDTLPTFTKHIENFDKKLTRANITGTAKEILMKSYITDIAKQNGLQVI